MLNKSLTILSMAALLAFCSSTTMAATRMGAKPASVLNEGGYTLPPIAFTRFCLRYPTECPDESGAESVQMTHGRLAVDFRRELTQNFH